MGAGTLPYHLRHNKAVDRQVFIDLLQKIHTFVPLWSHAYVGFAGPFLEDFRLMHSALGIHDLISVECLEPVYKRQKKNLPLSCIDCRLGSSGDFIDTYAVETNAIVWLDYAEPSELRSQLVEVGTLLPKLRRGDVFKVTLNAFGPKIVPDAPGMPRDELLQRRLEHLRNRIEEFLPYGINADEVDDDRYPSLLTKVLNGVSERAMRAAGGELAFRPLTAFAYADSKSTMLTFSGVVLRSVEIDEFLKKTKIGEWPLRLRESLDPIRIEVPVLSTRERLVIESMLPRAGVDEIQNALGYWVEDDEQRSKRAIESYVRFYRYYPYFSRIVP